MIFAFEPIGILHSCFKEKFGIPRQAGLVREAVGELEILPPYNRPEAFQALEGFSHLWLTFVFHAALRESWSPRVRPPRLGGNQRVGVFASRSPFRPNPLGLSLVELKSLSLAPNRVSLQLGGIDLLDQTPVLDIKPYIPYSDSIPEACPGYATVAQNRAVKIHYSDQAEAFLQGLDPSFSAHFRTLIRQILENDPRPAYLRQQVEPRVHGMRLYDFNIKWKMDEDVVDIIRINTSTDE